MRWSTIRGRLTKSNPSARALPVERTAGRVPRVPARQPLLRDRSAVGHGLEAVRRHGPPGWARVQAICDYVHNHITFGYAHARATRTAFEGHEERRGVCRDFAHLAVTLCRCMNIPARYCTGYLGDIGVPRDPAPMDFSAWFEAYLGGRWYTFDARHNVPRIGRIVIGPRPRRHRRRDQQHVRAELPVAVQGVDRRGRVASTLARRRLRCPRSRTEFRCRRSTRAGA